MDVLRRLRREFPSRAIRVIWDGAAYLRAGIVHEAAARARITLDPLPGYSPDFMPVEALWRWLREDVTYNRCHSTRDELIANVRRFEATVNVDPVALADRLWVKDALDPDEEKLRIPRQTWFSSDSHSNKLSVSGTRTSGSPLLDEFVAPDVSSARGELGSTRSRRGARSMTPPFSLNLNQAQLERYARDAGFASSNWKQDVLADVLVDGRLRLRAPDDPHEVAKSVWYCEGGRVWLKCAPDARALDTLFCIGIFRKSSFNVRFRSEAFDVPGPWGLYTFGHRGLPAVTIEQHLRACLRLAAPAPRVDPTSKPLASAPHPAPPEALKFQAFAGLRTTVTVGPPSMPAPRPEDAPTPVSPPSPPEPEQPSAPLTDPVASAPVADREPIAVSEVDASESEPVVATVTDEPAAATLRFDGSPSWDALALEAIVRENPALGGILDSADPRNARQQRVLRIECDIERLRRELATVPTEEAMLEAEELRRSLSDNGRRLMPAPPVLVDAFDSRTLSETLAALASDAFERLPPWILDAPPTLEQRVPWVLARPSLHAAVREGVQWVREKFAGAPPEMLWTLPDAGITGTVRERLERTWSHEQAVVTADLGPAGSQFVRSVPPTEVPRVAQGLRSWRDALHVDAFAQLVGEALGDPASSVETIAQPPAFETLPDKDRALLRMLPALDAARHYLDRCQFPRLSWTPVLPKVPAQGEVRRFAHVVTNEQGHVVASPIVIPPVEASTAFVVLEFAVRLVATAPIAHELEVTLRSGSMEGVARDALLPSEFRVEPGPKSIQVRWRLAPGADRWRPFESDTFSREEVACIALTRREAMRLRDETRAQLSVTLAVGAVSATLAFETMLRQPPTMSGDGAGSASASTLVRDRPLGAQIHHKRVESQVKDGRRSLMVVAPRRFGKTTLFNHLASHARESGHEVVTVTLERDLSPEAGAGKVWEAVGAAMQERYDALPALGSGTPASLLDERAWTAACRFVRQRSKGSLVVLVDEAQALIPRPGGEAWGHRFKNFVEQRMALASGDVAPVQFVLFGTVDLSVRMGANCRDFLLMYGSQSYVFEEESLARYLRTASEGALLTTRAARHLLAEWTSNLRTLLTVLDLVQSRLVEKRRAFLIDSDVDACIRVLLAPNNPMATELWSYARSELSHRDEWDPVDSFPLAVAWARDDLAGANQLEHLENCARWLGAQLRACGVAGTIPAHRVEAEFRDLKARGVLRDDGQFYRPLLRELLARRGSVLRDDRDAQLALLRLAVDQVPWPPEAAMRGQGGQASVFCHMEGSRAVAYRSCELDSDESRRRFARTCAALRSLRDRRTRMDGDDCLPRVTQAGFRSDNASVGVIVYDWIEGEPLEEVWHRLPADATAYVVRQVARAVQALHARDVIHCDVAPRNVLVDGKLEATLIDFGLARRIDHASHTKVGTDRFKAPEQYGDPPQTERASDVYALGELLKGARGDASTLAEPLRVLARRMTSKAVADRPDIAEVLRELDDVVNFQPAVLALRSEVDDVISAAPDFLFEDLMLAADSATMALSGCFAWNDHRFTAVSFLLNNLFVRIVNCRRSELAATFADLGGGDELSLAALRGRIRDARITIPDPWSGDDVRAVGLGRIAHAHPADRAARLDEAKRTVKAREATAFQARSREAVVAVARLLDGIAGSQVPAIARFIAFYTDTR